MSERRYEDATRPERWKTPTSNAPALQRALDDIDARLVALEGARARHADVLKWLCEEPEERAASIENDTDCVKAQPTGDKIPPIHTKPHKPCANGDTISAEGDGEHHTAEAQKDGRWLIA